MKFTQASVERFKLPAGKSESIVFDEAMPGFGLRTRGAGKVFIAQYKIGAKHRRITLGSAAKVTLDVARTKARQIFGKVADGKDPAGEKAVARKDASNTFGVVAADFLAVQTAKVASGDLRPATLYATTLYLNDHFKPLHRLALVGVDRAAVATQLRLIAKERGKVTADRARAAVSAMFAWAMGEGLAEANPVIGTNKAAGDYQSRDRVLTDAELAAVWKAAPDTDFGRIVRLLLLTGQRRDEIGDLRRSEIDTDGRLIALPGERTKNGRPHDVPLSESAMAILTAIPEREGRDLVFGAGKGGFSGWSKAKEQLDTASGITEWTLHDLRRTWATRAADCGVQPHVIEAALNHISGHRAGVAGTYNRAVYSVEKRGAMEAVASYITTAIAKAEGTNVTRLKPRALDK